MKIKHTLTALAFVAGSSAAFGQALISSLNIPVTDNFSSFEGTELTLSSDFSTFGSGFPDYGGFYDRDGSYSDRNFAYALREDENSSSIAFGMKRPSNTSIASLNWDLENNTGADVTSLSISWDAWQLSEAGRATELVLFNYNAGGSFTSSGLVSSTFTATTAGTDGNLSAITVSPQSATITLADPLANGETITLGWRWIQGAGGGGNAHVGLTNLSATAVPEPSAYGAIIGVAALALVVARRRMRA